MGSRLMGFKVVGCIFPQILAPGSESICQMEIHLEGTKFTKK